MGFWNFSAVLEFLYTTKLTIFDGPDAGASSQIKHALRILDRCQRKLAAKQDLGDFVLVVWPNISPLFPMIAEKDKEKKKRELRGEETYRGGFALSNMGGGKK